MKEKNFNYRSESIFSANRNLFEMLEAIDDEQEAKRSANFFNNNKNILVDLFKSTNHNNNVNSILLKKKSNINHVANSKDNKNKEKGMEIKEYGSEILPKIDNENCERKKWINKFCWFCSLHLLDEILGKEIYKEKIHEDVYDLIYDENTYFDTSSMMSIPYEFARFMLSQIDNNAFHKIKINNLIKQEKRLIKKICKNCTYNKKDRKISDISSSNRSCSSRTSNSYCNLSDHKKKNRDKNLINNTYNKLNDSNSLRSNNNYNINKSKTFYDSDNFGNSSNDLFCKKVPTYDYISNSNNFYENFCLKKEVQCKKNDDRKDIFKYKNQINDLINNNDNIENYSSDNDNVNNNNSDNNKNHNNNSDNNNSNNSSNKRNNFKFKKLKGQIVISYNSKKEDIKMKNTKKNNLHKETNQCGHTPFSKNRTSSFVQNKDYCFNSKSLNKNSKFECTFYDYYSKKNISCNLDTKNRINYRNKIIDINCYEEKGKSEVLNEKEEIKKIHTLKYIPNNENYSDYPSNNNVTTEKENNLNNYNDKVYAKYKNNLNYIKKYYYIDETKKKPFPLCLYYNVKCYSYVKQCVRCYCFFNSECCHCISCKKKYQMKFRNPHYFIFQHGLTASVHDFQNILNPLLTKYPHVFIYITYSNQGHTFEGVDVGTERICTELNCLFKIINDKINVSMIGHSLGGILNRSVLINLYKKKVFRNKKLINFITFACPHIGVHENMAIMKMLSTYLGSHTIDDLNNKTTLLLKIANIRSINILKKSENIIFYGNTQSDWLVGIRTSLILPYTLFNEELILFIVEQARNVPEIPVNIFSVVHLYMRKKKLLFFYFYQDLKNPNYLLNKRKEQSKFLDQMLQTIISSRRLLSYSSQKKKFNIFMNYYNNSDKKKIEKEKKNIDNSVNNYTLNEKKLYNKNDAELLSNEKSCKNYLSKNENNFELDCNNYCKSNLSSRNENFFLSDSVYTRMMPFSFKINSRMKKEKNTFLRNSFSMCELNSISDKNEECIGKDKKSKNFKSHEDLFLNNKICSNVLNTNKDKKYVNMINKKKYFKNHFKISENYEVVNSSNTTKNFELFKNSKIIIHNNSFFMKERNKQVKNENKNNDFNNETISNDVDNANNNDTINNDNIRDNIRNNINNGNINNIRDDINNDNDNINKKGDNIDKGDNNNNISTDNSNKKDDNINNNDTNNNSNVDSAKKKYGDYKCFEKLFFECLKTKIINEIKVLDNNLKKKKKKVENNKLFSLQNTIKIIKNYSFLNSSKSKLKNTEDLNDKKHGESKVLDDKIKIDNSNEKKNITDAFSNENDEDEHDLIHLCGDKNDEYNYINEFLYSSSDDNYEKKLKKSSSENILINKVKNNTENIKCVECKENMTINAIMKKKLKRSNLLKGITKEDKKKYKQILSHIYAISNEQLIEKFFKNPELLYYEVLFNCLNQLPIQRYSISMPIYSNAHVQIIAHPRICSEDAAVIKHFIEHLIL